MSVFENYTNFLYRLHICILPTTSLISWLVCLIYFINVGIIMIERTYFVKLVVHNNKYYKKTWVDDEKFGNAQQYHH